MKHTTQQAKALNKLMKLLSERGWSMVDEYVNTYTKITFKCDKGHDVVTRPSNIVKGGGCSICYGSNPDVARDKLIALMGAEGYVMLGKYVNNKTKVDVQCPNGHVYSIKPMNFNRGDRCKRCRLDAQKIVTKAKHDKIKEEKRIQREKDLLHEREIKEDGRLAHKVIMDKKREALRREKENKLKANIEAEGYVLVGKYINSKRKIAVRCPKGHDYTVKSTHFNEGKRCRICNDNGGFNPDKPAILYYLRVCGGVAYKIGITNRTVAKRFEPSDLEKIEVLRIVKYENGYDARREETTILREFKYAKYKGLSLLSSGNSELFDRDILGVDHV